MQANPELAAALAAPRPPSASAQPELPEMPPEFAATTVIAERRPARAGSAAPLTSTASQKGLACPARSALGLRSVIERNGETDRRW